MLSISDLKFYVDTNLQGFVSNGNGNEIHTVVGMDRERIYTNRSARGVFYDKFTPIMRRLSDIVNPLIDEKNNVLIPIVILAEYGENIHFNEPVNSIKNILIPKNKKLGFLTGNNYCCSWNTLEGKTHHFYFNENTTSFVSNSNEDTDIDSVALNQERLFKLLYYWNFWTGDQILFDKGIIIDINKI